MSNILNRLISIDYFNLGIVLAIILGVGFLYNRILYFIFPIKEFFSRMFPSITDAKLNNFPPGMVIIPSLLRDEYDFQEIIRAVHSCAINNYPGELYIIASADGSSENPQLYSQLREWISSQHYEKNIHLHITANEIRQGKLIAVYTAISYMKGLVSSKVISILPPIYFSVDADETVGINGLQKLVEKLMTRHWLTGNYRKAVLGQVCLNKGDMWKGWKSFFTIKGQNYLWVAKGFFTSTLLQENINIIPWPIFTGQLYTAWSDVIVEAPRFMGYLQTIKYTDCFKWWLGISLPKFSEYVGESLPEALCGNTDDTSIATFIAMSHWENGKLSWDPPKTPMHAFVGFLYDTFVERIQSFERSAKVYTFTPPNLKGLWNQRKRWMACRVEVSGRFWKSFLFYWCIGIPFYSNYLQVLFLAVKTIVAYILIPYMWWHNTALAKQFLIFYLFYYVVDSLSLLIIYFFEPDKKVFRDMIVASMFPNVPIFGLIFNTATMFWGAFQDILLFGCNVRFYPYRTLIKSRAQRIAIAYRIRRFISCCWRSIRYGDIPLKWSWIGWYEDKALGLENGFTGWTKETKSDYILR